MTTETTESAEVSPVPAPSPAIFTLDLGANGGVFAPTNAQELHDWVHAERQFWSWVSHTRGGNHRDAIDQSLAPLQNALNSAVQACQSAPSSAAFRQHTEQVQAFLHNAYIDKGFPHSSSALGKRVEQIRQRDPLEAQAYLFTFLPHQGYQFNSQDVSSWRGFLEGISERFGLSTLPAKESYEAALASSEELRAKLERVLGEKTQVFDELHRNYEKVALDIHATQEKHEANFAEFIERNQKAHDDTLQEHAAAMANLEQVFKEKMTLRAPVEYWEGRQNHHNTRAAITGRWTFGSMATLAAALGGIAYWVLMNLTDGKPEAWRVTVLVLIGVLGVWAVRLIVRMFLSHSHLATDAAERVTMVKTYLALLEGDKMPSDDDRKLILQALFRPASDGIVKDEGLPHPALEALTRIGGR